jgi:hypothetical protein
MKKILFIMKFFLLSSTLFLFTYLPVLSQSEAANHQKYWTYRDNLKRKYLKIGLHKPNGILEYGRSIPIENRDQVNTNCSGTGNRMRWGDATIHQGYYIATLATEYELLKRAGKDYQSTLNELYYAIAAVNRIDDYAEAFLQYPNQATTNRNGFLCRDDVEGNFKLNWQNAPDNVTCLSSALYNTETGSATNNFFNSENEMSQDQIYGLFLGFSFVKKFVDPSLVIQPTPLDAPMNLVSEVQAITDRIMNYVQQQWTESTPYWAGVICGYRNISFVKNWVIRNPVTLGNVSRGADMSLLAPFTSIEAQNITGISYNASVSRGISFPGVDPQCFLAPPTNPSVTFSLSNILSLWTSIQNSTWSNIVASISVPNLDLPVIMATGNIPWHTIELNLGSFPFDNSNRHMLLSLVACTNTFTKANTGRLAWDANMAVFDLVRSQLFGGGTWAPQSSFFNLLNPAPCEGTNSLTPNNPNPWHSSSRWWKPDGSDFTGEYNGLDYMFLYNLYMLEFGNQLPAITYQNESCPCSGSNKIDPYINLQTSTLTQDVTLDRKFPEYLDFGSSVPEYLTQNLAVNAPYHLTLNTEFIVCNNSMLYDLSPNGIVLGTPSGALYETGLLRIRSGSTFILDLNGDAIVHPNSKIIVEKGATFKLQGNARLIINDHATVIVEPGATFTWTNGTEIILQGKDALFDIQSNPVINVMAGEIFNANSGTSIPGGTLRLRDGAFNLMTGGLLKMTNVTFLLSDQSALNYKTNAGIQLLGDDATLSLWSNVSLEKNAVFTFTYPGMNSGQVQLGSLNMTAGNNCQFILSGQGKSDVILQLGSYSTLPDNLSSVIITDGTITGGITASLPGNSLHTFVPGSQFFKMDNCTGKEYESITLFGQKAYILNSEFNNDTYGISDFIGTGVICSPVIAGCTFTNCQDPVLNYGTGVYMNNNLFTGNPNVGWAGVGQMYSSYIGNSVFTDNNTGGTGLQITYSANGGAGITLSHSSLINNPGTGSVAVEGAGGSFTARCSEIAGNNDGSAITMADNGLVNLSNDYGGGFNNFSDNQFILDLYNAYAELNNGGNNFSIYQNSNCIVHKIGCTPYVQGEVSSLNCNGNAHVLPADHNFWGGNGFSPPSSAFDMELSPAGSCTDDVYYTDNSPGASFCPAILNYSFSGFNSNPLKNGNNVSVLNTPALQNIPLNIAVNNALSKMDTGIVNGYKDAVIQLTQILQSPVKNPTSEDEYISQTAYKKLMESFSSATEYRQLPDTMTKQHYDMISLLSGMIMQYQQKGNYKGRLYTTMDMASIYRLGGKIGKALSVVSGILSWVQPDDVDFVNEWICFYTAENNLRSGVSDKKRYVDEINQCRLNFPSHSKRKSMIADSNGKNVRMVSVMPNPNSGSFTIKINSDLNIVSLIEIYNASGKCVYKNRPEGKTELPLFLDGMASGIYVVKVVGNNGLNQTEKVVVQ